MSSLGSALLIFGIGSILLNFLEREFIIMMWVDNWGPEVGWGIRISMIVVGANLMVVAALNPGEEATNGQQPPPAS